MGKNTIFNEHPVDQYVIIDKIINLISFTPLYLLVVINSTINLHIKLSIYPPSTHQLTNTKLPLLSSGEFFCERVPLVGEVDVLQDTLHLLPQLRLG